MTLELRDGNRVVVRNSGTIEYHSVTGRVYRRGAAGRTYAEAVEWVRNSAWRHDVKSVRYSVS